MKHKKSVQIGFMIPFMIPLILFWIIPLISSFYISLTDWDYISPTYNFVGFENYEYMLTDPDFLKVLSNTFVFAFGTIGLTIFLGLMFALIFQKNFKGGRIYQLIIFSPWITPTVAVALVWSWIYEPERGFLNYVLGWFNIEPLQWLHSSDTAMLGIIIFTVWKSIGWTMLFYLGALEKVSKGAYEAAVIDGANWFAKFLHITLPLISPTTYFLFIINLISAIQVYDQIQIMTQGGPGGSTTTLLYMYYQKAFQNFQMGPANAIAMIILVIIMLLSVLSSFLSKRYVHYE